MRYGDYVASIGNRAAEALSRIETGGNLDYGPEFERAAWNWLRQAMPTRYGVCRGYIINRAGEQVGDDLIVYDRANFPCLRAEGEPGFDRKEKIPVEAVYGYLEAKHVLALEGGEDDGQTVARAMQQVAAAKQLMRTRPIPRIAGAIRMQKIGYPTRDDWPFGAIICRGIRARKGQPELDDPRRIAADLCRAVVEADIAAEDKPNLIIAGGHCVVLPVADLPTEAGMRRTCRVSFVTAETDYIAAPFQDAQGFGVGFALLLDAFDQLMLPPFSWAALVDDAFAAQARSFHEEATRIRAESQPGPP